jgi:hypothetical protein
MKRQHDDYLDGKLTVTHKALMATAKAKMDYLNSLTAKSVLAGEKLVATYSIST